MIPSFQSLPSRQLHLRPGQSGPHSPLCGTGAGMQVPGSVTSWTDFDDMGVPVDHSDFVAPHRGLCGPLSLRPLHRMTRLIGGMFTRSTFPNLSGSLAKGIVHLASFTAPNTPDLRLSRRSCVNMFLMSGTCSILTFNPLI